MKKQLLLLVGAVLFSSNFIVGQTTYSWRNDQSPISGQWNVSNYWWNGSGAALPGGGEILFLDGSVGTTMTNDLPSTNRHRILFGSGGSARTVNGITENTFYDYSSIKPKIENNSSNTQTINFPIKAGYNPMELNPVSGNLTIGGAINNNGNFIDVYGPNSKELTIGSTFSGAGGLTIKENSKVIYASVAKTYSGATVLDAGTLELQVNASSTSITVNNGATLLISGTDVTINSLTINGSGVVNIQSGKSLTVTGTLTNSNGAAGLVIEDGGSLITNGSVSGSATIKKVIASDSKRHFISSPVSGQNICDGVFAPLAANFNESTGATYDCYKWSESAGSLNWLNLKNADWSLNTVDFSATPQFAVGTGYLVGYTASYGGSTTKVFAGILTTGNQSVTLGNSGTDWNFIGNPFASAINWDGVTKDNLVDGYYSVYNENKSGGAGYEYYLDGTHKSAGANGKISVGQGFFVKASGTSLSLPNAARTHDNNWMKGPQSLVVDQLKLTLANGINYDESFIQFESQGTNGKDFFDAEKMYSMDASIPQLYSIIENEKQVAFNSMPYNTGSFNIPLGIYIPANGEYSLNLAGIETFATKPDIMLEDITTGMTQDLSVDQTYQFTASTDDNPNRFVLHFGPVGVNEHITDANQIEAYINANQIYINKISGSFLLEIFDLQGRCLQSKQIETSGLYSQSINLPAGVYLVRLQNTTIVKSVKVIVQ
jgi:hypothetical protein